MNGLPSRQYCCRGKYREDAIHALSLVYTNEGGIYYMTVDLLHFIPALPTRNVASLGDKPAYREKEFGIWQSWTWAQAADQIDALAAGLLTLGAVVDDHIAIVGRNRLAPYLAMVAAQRIGCVPVPMYQDAAAEEMAYALDHCGARLAVVSDQEQADKIADIHAGLFILEHIIFLDGRGLRKYDHAAITSYAYVKTAGSAAGLSTRLDDRLHCALQVLFGLGLVWIVTTCSHTASRPKP